MRTSIELPDELMLAIRKFNKENPGRPINMTGVCRTALQDTLERAQKQL